MLSFLWLFSGFLSGLLIVSVFNPAERKVPNVPTPGDLTAHHTGSGCVKFHSQEVPCDGKETSLNVLASQHK